jgi:hypothetical protein
MRQLEWGIPEAAAAALKKQGAKMETTAVFDIEYMGKGHITKICANPVSPEDQLLQAHLGSISDTVTG